MTAHVHTELMKQYAEDAAETATPWERWEAKFGVNGTWTPCTTGLLWMTDVEYRRIKLPQKLSYSCYETESGQLIWINSKRAINTSHYTPRPMFDCDSEI